ncbi:PREDICTED: glycoprotein integral membrane protein 1 [Rhinopithecus bieti]|nr:PREDICTED: glycoprotein integral membrane protein 1 [Rhinopithecus bieti]
MYNSFLKYFHCFHGIGACTCAHQDTCMCVYTNFKNNGYENIYIAQVANKGPYLPRLHSAPRRRAALRVRKRLSPASRISECPRAFRGLPGRGQPAPPRPPKLRPARGPAPPSPPGHRCPLPRLSKMEGAPPGPLALRLLLFVALPAAGWLTTGAPEPPPLSGAPQDGIRINVTTLKDDGDISKQQVVLNITYESGQVYVNDLPINSGVTRISCQTLIVKNENLENLEEKEYFGIVSVRILVHEWPMTSGSSLQLIVIQEEVVEIDGKQVQQKDVTEIDILVKNRGILRHSNYTLPLEESMLYSISRDSDILFTLPNLSKKESVSSLQTTSQYLIRNVETTVDEDVLPGKLPETPLRAEPPSSYKVMCQWMEKFRKDLCRFWSSVFPVFFQFLNIIVVGITGAAVLITILKVLFPVSEYKGILQLDKVDVIPVTAINLYPDGPEKTVENPEDKTCI